MYIVDLNIIFYKLIIIYAYICRGHLSHTIWHLFLIKFLKPFFSQTKSTETTGLKPWRILETLAKKKWQLADRSFWGENAVFVFKKREGRNKKTSHSSSNLDDFWVKDSSSLRSFSGVCIQLLGQFVHEEIYPSPSSKGN